jgi:hypothetical protein
MLFFFRSGGVYPRLEACSNTYKSGDEPRRYTGYRFFNPQISPQRNRLRISQGRQITQIIMNMRRKIAKSAGFNSPQLAALGLNLSFTDTPWLAAGKFIIDIFGYNIAQLAL